MTFGTPVSLETLLDSIEAKLGTTDGDAAYPDERVIVTLAPEDFFTENPPADQFIVISPQDFEVMDGQVAGGGNANIGTIGTLGIDLWNRFEVDVEQSDKQALKGESYGILAKWRAVMTSIHLFVPTDDNGKGIVIEPIRVRRWSIPPRRHNSPWIQIRSNWEVKFIQALD